MQLNCSCIELVCIEVDRSSYLKTFTLCAPGPFQYLRSYWSLMSKNSYWLRHRSSLHLPISRSLNGRTWASARTLKGLSFLQAMNAI